MQRRPPQRPIRPGKQTRLTVLVLVVLAVVVVAALTALDTDAAAGRAGLRSVEFGVPWGWVGQDLSSLDPPLPYVASPASPWEHPTTIAWAPLLADLVVVFAVLMAGWLLIQTVRTRQRTPTGSS